jgi:hypothetical protein
MEKENNTDTVIKLMIKLIFIFVNYSGLDFFRIYSIFGTNDKEFSGCGL